MARPSIADTPAEVAAILGCLPGRFKQDKVVDFTGVFHWDVVGAEQPHWTVQLGPTGCEVAVGHVGEPTCAIRISEKTFLGIETGKRSPVVAFVKGRIKVTNVGQMRRFDRAFYKFHDVPSPDGTSGM